MKEMLKSVKKWVLEQVVWAEKNLKGKTGAEKRAAVVAKVDDMLALPWWLEWADGPVIGWLVDAACERLNWLTERMLQELVEAAESIEAVQEISWDTVPEEG